MNSTKERPIIFNAQEVNAVLAGDKTQHRAPVLTSEQLKEGFEWDFGADGDSAIFIKKIDDERQEVLLKPSPFGAIGDRLWVQEPTHTANSWDWFYDATHSLVECKDPYTPSDLYLPWDDDHQEYTGPIAAEHMPYWASRILLEITDISIERVQDITLGDSLKEACDGLMDFAVDYWMAKHGEAAWFTSPWVWVIEFKVIKESNDG